jgi:hypothetical protein
MESIDELYTNYYWFGASKKGIVGWDDRRSIRKEGDIMKKEEVVV